MWRILRFFPDFFTNCDLFVAHDPFSWFPSAQCAGVRRPHRSPVVLDSCDAQKGRVHPARQIARSASCPHRRQPGVWTFSYSSHPKVQASHPTWPMCRFAIKTCQVGRIRVINCRRSSPHVCVCVSIVCCVCVSRSTEPPPNPPGLLFEPIPLTLHEPAWAAEDWGSGAKSHPCVPS